MRHGPTSRSGRARSPCGSTVRSSSRNQRPSCRWPSGTSSSDQPKPAMPPPHPAQPGQRVPAEPAPAELAPAEPVPGAGWPGAATAVLMLADARFPAGGHAHSGGLEAAAAAGSVTGLESLERFLRGRLITAGAVSAGLAAAACARARDGVWAQLDAEADAPTPAPAP